MKPISLIYACADCDFTGPSREAGDHFVLTRHQLTYQGVAVNFLPCYPAGEISPETFAAAVRRNLPLPEFPILPGGKFTPKRGA